MVEGSASDCPSAPAAAELLLHSVIAGATMQWAVDPDGELADHVLAQIAAILCLMFPEHDDFQLLRGTCVNGGVQSPCGRRRTRPSSISTGTVGGIEVLITTQVYGLQMVTIPILASEHRADSLTVNHSRKVVPVWVSRVETILRQCAQQTTRHRRWWGAVWRMSWTSWCSSTSTAR